jgi:DNA-directed RNA polymerase subunit M/transcription elongation factor TFIIS
MSRKRIKQTKQKSKLEKTIASCSSCNGKFPFKEKNIKNMSITKKIYSRSDYHAASVTDHYDVCEVTYRTIKCPICHQVNYLSKISTEKKFEVTEANRQYPVLC